jgi:hypothetical protein
MSKPPVVWHRLEDVNHVIGPTWTETGTAVFSAGKFGDGNSADTTSNYISTQYNPATYPTDQCTITLSWKPDYTSEVGSPRDGHLISWNYNSQEDWLRTDTDSFGGGNIAVATRTSNTHRTWYYWTTPGWTSGVNYDIGIVLDSTQGAGGKIKLYFNGVDQGAPTILLGRDSAWTFSNTQTMYLGKIGWGLGTPGSNGVVDNLKIFDYVKTNFDDRHSERGSMNDSVMTV